MASPALRRFRHRIVGLVLRTPLHQTLSRRFLLLRGVGDGVLDPPVALRYAAHESDLVVVAQPGSTWWRGLSAEAPTPCAVRHAGRDVVVPAVLAAGELLDESILRYLQKYPGEWRALGVDARGSAEDVEHAARGQAVIRIGSAPGDTAQDEPTADHTTTDPVEPPDGR